jgi:PBP1b-binding outer membrane lipoprotein LpoB
MSMRKYLSLIALCAALALTGCDKPKQKQSDAPAGDPDELKDSTRLDPAPEQKEADQPGPQ